MKINREWVDNWLTLLRDDFSEFLVYATDLHSKLNLGKVPEKFTVKTPTSETFCPKMGRCIIPLPRGAKFVLTRTGAKIHSVVKVPDSPLLPDELLFYYPSCIHLKTVQEASDVYSLDRLKDAINDGIKINTKCFACENCLKNDYAFKTLWDSIGTPCLKNHITIKPNELVDASEDPLDDKVPRGSLDEEEDDDESDVSYTSTEKAGELEDAIIDELEFTDHAGKSETSSELTTEAEETSDDIVFEVKADDWKKKYHKKRPFSLLEEHGLY